MEVLHQIMELLYQKSKSLKNQNIIGEVQMGNKKEEYTVLAKVVEQVSFKKSSKPVWQTIVNTRRIFIKVLIK